MTFNSQGTKTNIQKRNSNKHELQLSLEPKQNKFTMKKFQSLVADLSSKGLGVLILQNVFYERTAEQVSKLFYPLYSEPQIPITLPKSVSKTVYNYPVHLF